MLDSDEIFWDIYQNAFYRWWVKMVVWTEPRSARVVVCRDFVDQLNQKTNVGQPQIPDTCSMTKIANAQIWSEQNQQIHMSMCNCYAVYFKLPNVYCDSIDLITACRF